MPDDKFVTLNKDLCHLLELGRCDAIAPSSAASAASADSRSLLAYANLFLAAAAMKTTLSRILGSLFWLAAFAIYGWAAEKNPPGDIPDDQVFVSYKSPASGYSLKVPEGWSRSEKGPSVEFVDKFDGVAVTVDAVANAPTIKDVVSRLEKSVQGFKVTTAKQIQLPAGSALLIKYESESAPNPVTNKRIHLEDEACVFYKNGNMAILTLWAPVGADNVDQWKLISESFRW